MHIHGNINASQMPLNATQGTMRAAEARQAALAVKRKLTDFAATDSDIVSQVDTSPQSGSNPRQKKSQPDEENFRSQFVSFTV